MDAPPQPSPPRLAAQPSLGLFTGVILGLVAVFGAAVLFFFDPTKNNFYPICQFHLLTGLYCPGCGATRASYQLLHGNFSTALHDNALYVVSLMALAVRGIWFLKRRFYHQPVRFFIPPYALWTFLGVAIIFVVLRNMPVFSFLAPLQ
ncbi:MAG TPA: DUF2752 domain-containing protein [Pseudomonadales bacterium]|nr:DUF2752 domain-containing protein [Pseudomonadales bacterium]